MNSISKSSEERSDDSFEITIENRMLVARPSNSSHSPLIFDADLSETQDYVQAESSVASSLQAAQVTSSCQ